MTQQELNRQVADSTGDSIQTIEAIGFSPLAATVSIEERQRPLMIDWDVEDRIRNMNRRQF